MLPDDGRVVTTVVHPGRTTDDLRGWFPDPFFLLCERRSRECRLMNGAHTGPMNIGNLMNSPFASWPSWCALGSTQLAVDRETFAPG